LYRLVYLFREVFYAYRYRQSVKEHPFLVKYKSIQKRFKKHPKKRAFIICKKKLQINILEITVVQ